MNNRCDYNPGPLEQEVRWLSDREAEVTILGVRWGEPGSYGLAFGGGKDPAGREIREPYFSFALMPARRVQVYAVPVAGGEPRLLFDRALHMEARSISPDGRYLLLVRELWAHADDHNPVRVPYVADLETGRISAYDRAPVLGVRWDLEGGTVWLNGWQRIRLGGRETTVESFLHRAPAATGPESAVPGLPDAGMPADLLDAWVSTDGCWLAAARGGDHGAAVADLVITNLETGESRTGRGGTVCAGTVRAAVRRPVLGAGDGRAAGGLGPARRRPGHGHSRAVQGQPADPGDHAGPPAARRAPVAHPFPWWARYLEIYGYGIITHDGRDVLRDPQFRGGYWSQDDRFWLPWDANYQTVVEMDGGRRSDIVLPEALRSGYLFPLGLSSDGSVLYLARS